jgi:transposase
MEATRRHWRNVFTFLVAEGFSIALLNPLRARRFAEEDLQRTKTGAIDALGIRRLMHSLKFFWSESCICKHQDLKDDQHR